MKRFVVFKTVERFLELLLSCVAISSLISFLCICGIIPDGSTVLVVGLYAAAVMFAVINAGMMRATFCELRSYRLYYIVNIGAYMAFIFVNLLSYKLFSKVFYTWMFGITKAARYSVFNISTLKAVGLFHLMMLVVTALASLGMGWVKFKEEEELELMKNAPGFLEINPEIQKKTDENKEEKENNGEN